MKASWYRQVDGRIVSVSPIPVNKFTNLPDRKGHRLLRSVVIYAVWAYFRFTMSLRDVQDLLAERGIAVFIKLSAHGSRNSVVNSRNRSAETNQLDEVVMVINERKHRLSRAFDAEGDVLVQLRGNTMAAKRFMRRLVKHYGEPRVLITDKLHRYGAAKCELIAGVEHRQHKGLNNKAEISHKQTR